MTLFTSPDQIPYPEQGDNIKDGVSASALADIIKSLAIGAQNAALAVEGRSAFVKGDIGPSRQFSDIDNLPEGFFRVPLAADAQGVGLPARKAGMAFRFVLGSTSIMYQFTHDGEIHSRFSGGTSWSVWSRRDGYAYGAQYAQTNNVFFDAASFDPLTAPAKVYSFWTANDAIKANMPAPAAGNLYVGTAGSFRTFLYLTVTSPSQIWVGTNIGGAINDWHQLGSGSGGGSGVGSGFKNAALPLSQQSAGGTEQISDATVRFPVHYGVGFKRARLHVQNFHYYTGSKFTGPVSFNGAWFGTSSAGDFIGTPTQVLSPFITPEDGSEYVSEWFNIGSVSNTQQLISLGFTTAPGQVNALSKAGCYRSASSANASQTGAYSGVLSNEAPFDWWLEVEVPADTPILGGFGNSNTVGSGSTLPVHDSWLSQYCRSKRALPYFMAVHGATTASWSNINAPAWSHYKGAALPDAVVYFMHQNDLQEGVTLTQLQANFSRLIPLVREKLSENIYLATVTPANNKSAAVNLVRRSLNTWMKTKPLGAKDCFDFSGAVSIDDTTIRPEFNVDGVHMATTAHSAMSALLEARPVTPSVKYAVDQIAGRVVKVWDYLNNREQMVYGDTGWRSLTVPAVAPLEGTGSILVRRVGSRVTMQFDSVGYTGAGTPEYMTATGFLPNGFCPDYSDNPHGLIANLNTNRFFFIGILQASRLRFSHFLVAAPGIGTNALRGQISWTTTQAWPTMLPGAASGTIPYQ